LIVQHLVGSIFASFLILGTLFGASFYSTTPLLLTAVIPITSSILYITLSSKAKKSKYLAAINKKHNVDQSVEISNATLKTELTIFLTTSFLSDTLALFSMIQLGTVVILPPLLIPSAVLSFVLSIIIASYIHLQYRYATHLEYYSNIQAVYKPLNLSAIPLKPVYISLMAYSALVVSLSLFYLWTQIGCVALALTATGCIYQYQAIWDTNFSIYSAIAAQVSFLKFSDHLKTLLNLAHINSPPKLAITLITYAITVPCIFAKYTDSQRDRVLSESYSKISSEKSI
jgi:hypothetical protein